MNNHKTKEANEKSEKILDYISANSEQGVTIKDIGIAFNMPAETVRHYVKALFNNGYVDRKQQGYGSTHRYFWKKPEDKTQNTMEDTDREEMGGVERDPDTIIKCGEFCKTGDVVECSSRSGEGLYFKYLVLVPWERKAMVIGIFPEGHPNLNLNDPNHIYIGDDPETGNKLYVDVTNVCQRGYKTFGKRFFHAEKERMDDVKSRLKRVLRLSEPGPNIKAENQELQDDIWQYKLENKAMAQRYEQEIKDLKDTLNVTHGAAMEYEAKYGAALKKQQELENEIEKLKGENRDLTNQNEEFRQQIIEFSHGKEPIDPKYVESLEAKYGDALIKLKAAETRVEDYDYFTDVMKDIVMKVLDKGGN